MTRARRDAALFAAALALRILHVAAVRNGPTFRYLFIDSAFYDAVGRRLASGEGFPPGPFFMNVLHGLFLGAVYSVFGADERGRLAALAIQAVAGAVSVVLLARIGDALGRPRDGVIAAALLAGFGPAIFYDGALLTPSLLLLLTTGATLLAIRCRDLAPAPGGGRSAALCAAGLGALGGLLILGRASHALLVIAWMLLLAARGTRGRGLTLMVGSLAALVVAPVTIRNVRASGDLVWVTANSGMALWAGNHGEATGIYSEPPFLTNPVPEREAEDYRAEASRRAGRDLSLAQSSAFWTREALRLRASDPAGTLALVARKLQLYFHATEPQTNLSYYFARDFSPLLDVLRLHLGWILPFALVGLAAEARPLVVPLLPVLASLATCLLFYVSSEYRHPVAPLLLLFAVAGARHVLAAARAGHAWRRAGVVAGMCGLAVATNARDPMLARLQSRRVDYLNFATLAAEAGDLGAAERFARESVAIDAAWPESRKKLAWILQRAGRVVEAGEEDRLAGALPGSGTDGRSSAALAEALRLYRAGRLDEARDAFLALAERDAEARATALNNAGLCEMESRRPGPADSLFAAAMAAEPAYASPVVHRGRLALARGDSAGAIGWARRALALEPGDGRAQRLLARATGAAPVGGGAPLPD